MMSDVSTEVLCKCGMKGWLDLGEVSDPCPKCGKRYEFILKEGIGVVKRVYRKRPHK